MISNLSAKDGRESRASSTRASRLASSLWAGKKNDSSLTRRAVDPDPSFAVAGPAAALTGFPFGLLPGLVGPWPLPTKLLKAS